MHFYESSIITTKDGLYCQVYGNEHPKGRILVKPKYIPTDKIHSDTLPYRFIAGRKMNRLNLWRDKAGLKKYISDFSNVYPHYIFKSDVHDKSPLFFAVPERYIEREYSPKTGLADLMSMPLKEMDEHLRAVFNLVSFLLKSGLKLQDMGITYSTLMGHYSQYKSDMNIVVYGKKKFWDMMGFLKAAKCKELRWKNYEEWEQFYTRRNRHMVHNKQTYLKNMERKKSEGFFNDTLFVIFAVENENETWFKWGEEKYRNIGFAKFSAIVDNSEDSAVRPGRYDVFGSKFIDGYGSCKNIGISKVVFYSRDYCVLAIRGEKIEVKGVVEEVTRKSGEKYYRIVVGYFDSYLTERREQEYIKVLDENGKA